MKRTRRRIISGALAIFVAVVSLPALGFELAEKSGMVSVTQTVVGEPVCKTGMKGRAQLDLSNGGIIRLGANSILSCQQDDAHLNLVAGTALFDFGRKSSSLRLEHASRKIVVTGGTGFARYTDDGTQGEILLLGALANDIAVGFNGKSLKLRPGELIAFDAQGKSLVSYFNLAKAIQSGTLLNDFDKRLPSETTIKQEARSYVKLQKRGFIRPNEYVNKDTMLADGNLLRSGNEAPLAGAASGGLLFTLGEPRAFGGMADSSSTFAGSGAVTISSVNSAPDVALSKMGSGTLVLSSANTYGSATILADGAMPRGTVQILSAASTLAFAGGVLGANGSANGHVAAGGLTVSSHLFAGSTLTINGWAGIQASDDRIFITFGSVDSAFLDHVTFTVTPTGLWQNMSSPHSPTSISVRSTSQSNW